MRTMCQQSCNCSKFTKGGKLQYTRLITYFSYIQIAMVKFITVLKLCMEMHNKILPNKIILS